MYPHHGRLRVGLVIMLSVVLVAGCRHAQHVPAKAQPSFAPGFEPGPASSQAVTQLLAVKAVTAIPAGSLHPAPLPPDEISAAVRTLSPGVTGTQVKRLLVLGDFRSGAQYTVAALPTTAAHHAVLMILQGPNYRAERLGQVDSHGVVAGTLKLPAMGAGAWLLAVLDASELHQGGSAQITGKTVLCLGIYHISQ